MRWYYFIYLTLNLLDLLLTQIYLIGSDGSFYEKNPIGKFAYEKFGVFGLVVLKIVGTLIVCASSYTIVKLGRIDVFKKVMFAANTILFLVCVYFLYFLIAV